jgi:hypothetical protein
MIIKANNPALTSWIKVESNSDFPIQNLPFGIYSDQYCKTSCLFCYWNIYAIDLYELAEPRLFFKELNISTKKYSIMLS